MKLVILDPIITDRTHLIQSLERYFHKRQIDFTLQEFSTEREMLDNINFECEQLPCCLLNLSAAQNIGLDVGQRIRKMNQNSLVLFTSHTPNHAAEAYRMQADGYLLKPIITQELEAALNKCLKNIDFIYKKIRIRSEYMTMNIPLKDILYIEVFNKTCIIHTNQKLITSSVSLSELEQQLEKEGFLRCHKSYLVNMRYIQKNSKAGFFLANKQFIPISKRESLKHRETHMSWLWKSNA